MKAAPNKLQVALQTKRLNSVTKALSELAEKLAYQLKPDQFAQNLEVTSRTLNQIPIEDFLEKMEAEPERT